MRPSPPRSFLPIRDHLRRGGAHRSFELRVSVAGGEENPAGAYVLYWMQANRRIGSNPALEYALHLANRHGLPLVVFESLRPDYPAANDRIHRFILEGARNNHEDAESRGLRYVFFLPRTAAEAKGVLARLAADARLVVTDEYPTFVIRDHTRSFASRTTTLLLLFDGNGILPMRAFPGEQYSARFLRDRAHRRFEELWSVVPEETPAVSAYRGALPVEPWDGVDVAAAVASCEIDHTVTPVAARGGRREGLRVLRTFLDQRLPGYASGANRGAESSSELSAWMHFGFVGIHEIAEAVLSSDAPDEDIDAFLEQAIIRRELSFNLCHFNERHDSLAALPDWARKTLDAHRSDRRKPLYPTDALVSAATDDAVWNLAQRALLKTGRIHNYLRMLWGKKIIEWTPTPEEAHAVMLRLHERYAIDGRDPNTHAGVLWCFGKHDRPWAPERPVFGTIRWMSSDSTRRKVDLGAYEAKIHREDPTPR